MSKFIENKSEEEISNLKLKLQKWSTVEEKQIYYHSPPFLMRYSIGSYKNLNVNKCVSWVIQKAWVNWICLLNYHKYHLKKYHNSNLCNNSKWWDQLICLRRISWILLQFLKNKNFLRTWSYLVINLGSL